MRDLSSIEKYSHHNDLSEYIRMINHYILKNKYLIGGEESFFDDFKVELIQVGYGVLVDDSYVYFDFPYHESVEKFNHDLANHKYVQGVDISMHNHFHNHNSPSLIKNGFVYYKYLLDQSKKVYLLSLTINNIDLTECDQDLLKFLPIMDCATTNENTYLYPVENYNGEGEFKELLVLSHRIGVKNKFTPDNNILICAFKIKKTKENKLEKLTQNLYDVVFLTLEKYFDSPVLTKLISEKRRSYILAHKHTLHNLHFNTEIDILAEKAKDFSVDFSKSINRLREKVAILNLTHCFIFDYELLEAGNLGVNFMFKDKKVEDVFEVFFECHPNFRQLTKISGKSNSIIELINRNGDYVLLDLYILLWNLWVNASIVSLKSGFKVDITISEEQNLIMVIIKNYQRMPIDMVNYIGGQNDKHPKYEKSRPIRGWAIIKDILKNSNCLSLTGNFFDDKTEMILKLNK